MRVSPHPSLGEFIRIARVAHAYSLRDVAKHLKISPSYLSDIENDRRVPAEPVLRGLADRLILDFDILMSLAGRLDSQTQRLLRRAPAAAVLFRKLSNLDSPDEATAKLLETYNRQIEGKNRKKS